MPMYDSSNYTDSDNFDPIYSDQFYRPWSLSDTSQSLTKEICDLSSAYSNSQLSRWDQTPARTQCNSNTSDQYRTPFTKDPNSISNRSSRCARKSGKYFIPKHI